MNIVPTKTNYSYQKLKDNIQYLESNYPFIHSGIIGYSPLGKSIFYLRLGNGPKEVFYSASFHANEWITSLILMKFIEDYSNAYQENSFLYGYSIRKLFQTTSIYIVPMVNPDGVDLVTGNLEDTNAYCYAKSIAKRYPNICFPNGWKANIEGVDLKNYQPFYKVLQCLYYKALLFFIFLVTPEFHLFFEIALVHKNILVLFYILLFLLFL